MNRIDQLQQDIETLQLEREEAVNTAEESVKLFYNVDTKSEALTLIDEEITVKKSLIVDELDKEKCSVDDWGVLGIYQEYYDEYVGVECTISSTYSAKEENGDDFESCKLLPIMEYDFNFPIGCLKKL